MAGSRSRAHAHTNTRRSEREKKDWSTYHAENDESLTGLSCQDVIVRQVRMGLGAGGVEARRALLAACLCVRRRGEQSSAYNNPTVLRADRVDRQGGDEDRK